MNTGKEVLMMRKVSEQIVEGVLGVLQVHARRAHSSYWEGGVSELAKATALSRREVRAALLVLQARGEIVYKSDRRGRGHCALIRLRKRAGGQNGLSPRTPLYRRE